MNTVLAVDDEILNLELIESYLDSVDIETISVNRGDKALQVLRESPNKFSAILLDRVMPGIDGMEVLSKIKSDDSLSHIPVIMQTARTGKDNVVEGLNAGAHYYVTKPYDDQTLVSIVSAAIRDHNSYVRINNSLRDSSQSLITQDNDMFSFKSLNEGNNLAAVLANTCPDPDNVVLGLTELMTNAVEHGNLGISYKDKSKLIASGEWENEVVRRLELPENKDKYATIEFSRNSKEIKFLISDQGDGFDWVQYMEISPNRLFDSHGRGIAMANLISFDKIKYLGNGNKVCMTITL